MSTETKELWFLSDIGGEPLIIYRTDDGALDWTVADEAPEEVLEVAPTGWCVWDGTRRPLTAEDIANDDEGIYPTWMKPGDWWWSGRLEPASTEDVAAFCAREEAAP